MTRRRHGPSKRMRQPVMPREDQRGPSAASARPATGPEILRTVLAIAGVDTGGGAGIAADLKTIAAYRHHGAPVITSITAQNTVGIHAIYDIPGEFVARQIESVVTDIDVHAVKIGMLGTARAVEMVASQIEKHELPCVVLDPVLRASTGSPLLEKAGIAVMKSVLLPKVFAVTPNMDEAAALSGMNVDDLESMKEAARRIHELGPRCVVVTGGHLASRAIDVLYDGARFAVYDATRIASTSIHGIGCTFSTAIACQLARGDAIEEAVGGAKRYVMRAVSAPGVRAGKGAGPLNQLVSPF